MTREVVDERQWVDATTFSRALQLAMLLPGPEALQTAIYVGWRLYGVPGAVASGLCFLLPGTLLLLALSFVYMRFGALVPVAAALSGLKAVVVAVVALALVTLARRLLLDRVSRLVASLAAILTLTLHWSSPVLLALGAAVAVASGGGRGAAPPTAPGGARWGRLGSVLALGTLIWTIPWLLVHVLAPGSRGEQIYLLLSRVAIGGFGGAYAMMAWVGQLLVHQEHWLGYADLTAGIGLAESTPGPLLLALPFYAFVIGWQAADLGSAVATASLCAGLALWATFLPSFVLVVALAPEVERLATRPRLSRALEGVGAAVVGVIATFAVNVAMTVVVPAGTVDGRSLAIVLMAGALLGSRRLGLLSVLVLGTGLGVLLR